MKKQFCLFIFLIIGMIGFARSSEEDIPNPKNEFKISITRFFVSTFSLEYERMFNNSTGLVLQADGILTSELESEIIGFQSGLQYRIYSINEPVDLFDGSVEKLYMGPYVSYRMVEIKPNETMQESSVIHSTNTGIMLGMKVVIQDKLTFDFNLGGGVQYSNGTYKRDDYLSYDLYFPDYSGIKPRAGIAVGLKF
ncbi:MAG: hypothetical protein GVY19_06355 [Bacteroidetes bacterium]|jgi:hypothetical protein|nr:hypothetical protein [Bacteroidota bacterium]